MTQINRVGEATVVRLDRLYESLDPRSLGALRDVLLREADVAQPPYVVIDFTATEMFGSSFIEVLFRAYKRLKQRDGRMVLCGLNPFCLEVLRATRLDSLWAIYPSQSAAVEAVLAA